MSVGAAKQLLWRLAGRYALRATFHDWYALRRVILRFFGARVAKNAIVRPSVRIDAPWRLTIEEHGTLGDFSVVSGDADVIIGKAATVSQYAQLCTSPTPRTSGTGTSPRAITLGAHAWVAAEAFVGPGVQLGEGTILGARGVAEGHLRPWTIYGGHPARVISPRPPLEQVG